MAAGEENFTTTYDYSSYYYESPGFSPCSNDSVKDFGQLFIPIIYSLVFVLGIIGNGLVVCVLVKHRHQTNLTAICLFNLATSDLVFVVTLPFYACYTAMGRWPFGDFMCRLASGCHSTGFFSSVFFMVVMTLDRYVVIVHARTAARYRTLALGVAVSAAVWTLSTVVSLPNVVFTTVRNVSDVPICLFDPESDAWRLYDIASTNALGLAIPLLVMIVCYSRVIPVLLSMRSAKKHRAIKVIISIVVVFFLFWAPYNVSLFLDFVKAEALSHDCDAAAHTMLLITVTETIAYAHCCLNPIIYAFVGQKFMRRVVRMLRGWVPGLQLRSARASSDSSFRKSSVTSRSSFATSSFAV